jgi:hypothetical protein
MRFVYRFVYMKQLKYKDELIFFAFIIGAFLILVLVKLFLIK